MKRISGFFGVALTAALVSIPAYSQQAPTPAERQAPAPTTRQAPAPADKATAEKTFSGQLSKVDTSAKLIAVKGPDQKDMMFNYNDETQVISPDKTVQGLSGKTGAQLRISYREERGTNLATKIELVETK